MALAKLAGELWDGFEDPARALAVKAGGEFHDLSGEPLAEIKTIGDQLSADWIANSASRGLDGKNLVDTARNLIKKYE